VRVDPANASAMQTTLLHERRDFRVRDRGGSVHGRKILQQRAAPRRVAQQQLAVDQVMPADLATSQEIVERVGVRPTAGQEANPDRRINEDHQAAGRLDFDRPATSRWRGTLDARGSVPRRARSRS